MCGTYVHGVFDKEAVAEAIVQIIGEKKGLDVSGMTGMDFQAFKETQYDILTSVSSETSGYEENMKSWKRGINMKVEPENVKPMDIEKRSFEIITEELGDTL